jgi:biotin carboxylase
MADNKDIILFINEVPHNAAGAVTKAVKKYSKKLNRPLKIAVVRDIKQTKKEKANGVDYLLVCDFTKPSKVIKTLQEISSRLLAVTCRSDKNMEDFARIVPYLPYMRTPSSESIRWSVDKIAMRQHFHNYDPKISPRFTVVSEADELAIKKIKEKVGFPLVIKPAGLGASLLVSICYHEEELEKDLKKVLRKIKRFYKNDGRKEEPKILIEEFMEGEMFSIDAYVSSRGTVSFCPPCQVKTGKMIGFDDFFGYEQMTPTTLKKEEIGQAELVAKQAIHAMCLRSTTAHVELIKTRSGFKVIELGPRVGGFRHQLYELAFGIDHSLNDILTRVPGKLILPKKTKGHSVAMKFFAKQEGLIKKINGINKIKALGSFVSIEQNKKVGDKCRFAKNGGRSVANLIMFNESRSGLLADIRRAEKFLQIIT